MAKQTVIAPTASAVSNVVFDAEYVKSGTLSITTDGLATTEEVDLEIYAGNDTYVTWGNNSGTAYKLTASIKHLSLPNPGVNIRISKDATASPCGVIVSWVENTKRGY
jgi:hypothetical protein